MQPYAVQHLFSDYSNVNVTSEVPLDFKKYLNMVKAV